MVELHGIACLCDSFCNIFVSSWTGIEDDQRRRLGSQNTRELRKLPRKRVALVMAGVFSRQISIHFYDVKIFPFL